VICRAGETLASGIFDCCPHMTNSRFVKSTNYVTPRPSCPAVSSLGGIGRESKRCHALYHSRCAFDEAFIVAARVVRKVEVLLILKKQACIAWSTCD
jgi:hypothetical protein